MADNPWIKFYPSDWLSGTFKLSAEERGVYITLLMMIYESPHGAIEHDPPLLARMCAMSTRSFNKTVASLVKSEKIDLKNGEITNEKATKLLQNLSDYRAQKVTAAKARWETDKSGKSTTSQKRTQSVRNADADADASIPHMQYQNPEARIPPNPPYAETEPPASSEPGEGSDDRKAKARSIIGAFDDSIAEVWGPEQRRAYPKPMDIQTALDWVDAGAEVEVCRRVFLEVGRRFAESGQPPPGSLKARDRDVRQALAATVGAADASEPSRELLLSSGERAFGFAVKHLPSEQSAALRATANDQSMTDLDRARKAKQMLAEAGMRT